MGRPQYSNRGVPSVGHTAPTPCRAGAAMLAVEAMSEHRALPLIGIPACVREIGIHPFHAVGEKYINAVAHGAGGLPVLIPAFGAGQDLEPLDRHIDLDDLVGRLDGLFLTGSPSNVEPRRYGGSASAPGTHHDVQRDETTLPLIRAAVSAGLPLLAVCRGIQEFNVAFGGTLHQRVQEVPGLFDHREDKAKPRAAQYEPAHAVALTPGGLLAGLAGATEVMVNSLHAQAIDRPGDGLAIEATAPDGLVEAVRVEGAPAFALGVQWHPEWRVRDNPFSLALFEAFGDAARARAQERLEPRATRGLRGRVA